jgi:cytochrome c-type biogenesis protein
MDETPTMLAALGAGVFSIVSPGVVPLLPAFVGFTRRRGAAQTFAFLLGFSAVFVAIGAGATALGQLLLERLAVFESAAGIVLVALGLRGLGVPRRPARAEHSLEPATPVTLIAAVVVGGALAFGWTPLAGVVLNHILAIATSPDTIARGVTLLGVYAIGRALSMAALAFAIPAVARTAAPPPAARLLDVVAGAGLVLTGLLVLTGTTPIVAAALAGYLPFF